MGTVLTLLIAVIVLAEPTVEWARFRGPNGSGVLEVGALPAEFGPAKNVVWKTDLPQGYSSPIIFGNRIYLTGFRDGTTTQPCAGSCIRKGALGAGGAA